MIMRRNIVVVVAWMIVAPGAFLALRGQEPAGSQAKRFTAPPGQELALRAGRLFDSRTGVLLANQVVLIKGDTDAKYSAIMQAMDDLRKAGIEDIGLITEKKRDATTSGGK